MVDCLSVLLPIPPHVNDGLSHEAGEDDSGRIQRVFVCQKMLMEVPACCAQEDSESAAPVQIHNGIWLA